MKVTSNATSRFAVKSSLGITMVEAAGSKCSEEQLGREDFTVVTAAASNYKKGGRVLYRPNILKEDLKRMRLQLKRILSRF